MSPTELVVEVRRSFSSKCRTWTKALFTVGINERWVHPTNNVGMSLAIGKRYCSNKRYIKIFGPSRFITKQQHSPDWRNWSSWKDVYFMTLILLVILCLWLFMYINRCIDWNQSLKSGTSGRNDNNNNQLVCVCRTTENTLRSAYLYETGRWMMDGTWYVIREFMSKPSI